MNHVARPGTAGSRIATDKKLTICDLLAGVIEPALQAAETARSANRPTNDLPAYDLYLRAISTYFPITKARTFAALELLNRALEIDPARADSERVES